MSILQPSNLNWWENGSYKNRGRQLTTSDRRKNSPTSGELRTFCSISSAHGVDISSSLSVLERKIPKNSSGKLIGQLHCLGATQICARGNFLENGPTKILCSYANVGRTMYSTGASNSFTSWYRNGNLLHLYQDKRQFMSWK